MISESLPTLIFELQLQRLQQSNQISTFFSTFTGLECAEIIKTEFDSRWSPNWHVIIGRNFGSFVNHETRSFVFFYLGDKAIMIFKAG